ncbi:MAG: ornithine decarboxylase, partial [Candidatus Competibacteraceae bacterium]|nr:ornithine decarboxylase [Candidatus Competibacteraceae bacterium]
TRDGDLRRAFFMSYKDENCEYIKLNGLRRVIANGREVVSAMFVIPYPPGFPVLVPGQVISEEIMAFMQALDTREIHGYRPELGFRVFTEKALLATAGTTGTTAVTATPEPPAPAEAPANEPAE